MTNQLRFGIFLAPFHAMNEDPTLAMDRDMALLEHLDSLSYEEAWIGEHHSGGFEIIASPELFIAAAAERTKHIRLGTGVYHLRLYIMVVRTIKNQLKLSIGRVEAVNPMRVTTA